MFISIPKKGNAKECSNYSAIWLISHAIKFILKILQVSLQQYVSWELPDVQAGFRKGRGTRDQTANICWIMEKAREFQKNIYFWSIEYAKAFDYVGWNKLGKFLKEGSTRPPYLSPETLVWGQEATVQIGYVTTNWFQIGKCVQQAVYLTYMQSTSCEMPGWMNHRLESRLPGEISTTSDMHLIPL